MDQKRQTSGDSQEAPSIAVSWLNPLFGVALPAWSGPRSLHLKLTDGDVNDEPEEIKEPEERPLRLTCSKCQKSLPSTTKYFYRATREKWGLMYECKACHNTRIRSYRKRKEEQASIGSAACL